MAAMLLTTLGFIGKVGKEYISKQNYVFKFIKNIWPKLELGSIISVILFLGLLFGAVWIFTSNSSEESDLPYPPTRAEQPFQQGDLSKTGGSPTFRVNPDQIPFKEDDPLTSNDESNDQVLGYYGTETIEACTTHNNQCYELDADVEDGMVQRLYFPKGGWVDFDDGEFDGDSGWGEDENGREWEFTGF